MMYTVHLHYNQTFKLVWLGLTYNPLFAALLALVYGVFLPLNTYFYVTDPLMDSLLRVGVFVLWGAFAFTLVYCLCWYLIQRMGLKAISDDEGMVAVTYDITSEAITERINDNTRVEIRREHVRSVKLFKRAAFVKHSKGKFLLVLPAEHREAAVAALRDGGWL